MIGLRSAGVCYHRNLRLFTSDRLAGGAYYQWVKPTEDDSSRPSPEAVFEAGMRHHHIANTAYPIGHLRTIRPYRVPRKRSQAEIKEVLSGAFGPLKEMMLYAHVPFCHTRCQFCEYTVIDPKQGRLEDTHTVYFDALLKEMELYRQLLGTQNKTLVGFDIGGGTPSFTSAANIGRVMDKVAQSFTLPANIEISIETTPQVAANEPDKIIAYKKMGINRISMGLQTMDFELSKKLGRNDENYVRKAVDNVRQAGFDSFNIDLMYGFPVRPGREELWPQTVLNTIALQPDHITLYRMRYKGTRMSHLQSRISLDQVNFQEAQARTILENAGYHGWMGKNTFSRTPGSSGCSAYLERRVLEGIPYIGVGLGAQSFSRHTLSYNLGAVTKRLFQYLKSVELDRIPIQDLYHMSLPQAIGKFCSVSFYFGGIDRNHFRYCFGVEFDQYFAKEVEFLKRHKLMEDVDTRFAMTAAGKRHFGGVVSLFYAPAVQKYLCDLPGGDEFQIDVRSRDYGGVLGDVPKPVWPPLNSSASVAQAASVAGASAADSEDWAVAQPDGSVIMAVDGKLLRRAASKPKLMHAAPLHTSSVKTTSLASSSITTTHKRSFSTAQSTARSVESDSALPHSSPQLASTHHNQYEFGNILFGGPCNQKCWFCIGKQISPTLSTHNLKLWPLKNIDGFVRAMKQSGTKKVIMTGTTTDPQLYKYERELLSLLREQLPGVHISLHTNGLLALQKLDVFNSYDNCTISYNSFYPDTFRKIHGVKSMPDLEAIMRATKIPVKLSCIVTNENKHEMEDYLARVARLGIKRVAVRHLFRNTESWRLFQDRVPVSTFCDNPVYSIHGVEVTYWHFDSTSVRSLNLFADGTLSDEYLLAKAPGAAVPQN